MFMGLDCAVILIFLGTLFFLIFKFCFFNAATENCSVFSFNTSVCLSSCSASFLSLRRYGCGCSLLAKKSRLFYHVLGYVIFSSFKGWCVCVRVKLSPLTPE